MDNELNAMCREAAVAGFKVLPHEIEILFVLYCSMYCLCVNVYCTVLLPPGDNPIAVNKYIINTLVKIASVLDGIRREARTISAWVVFLF